MLRFAKYVLCFVSLACLLELSVGQIVESKESLMDSRSKKFLSAISENLGFGEYPLAKGHAIATISVAGCNLSVLLVGPAGANGHDYATAVNRFARESGYTGKVKWSSDDESVTARFSYHPGHFGDREASTLVDPQQFLGAVRSVEPNVECALSSSVWAPVDPGVPATKILATGTKYWDLSKAATGMHRFEGKIAVANWIPVVLLVWFLLPPVGILVCFGLGVLTAKNSSIPLKLRRKRYAQLVVRGSMGVIMVHSVMVVATLPTRVFEPISQLWFGLRFAQVAIPIVPFFAFIPMAALLFMNRVEKKLMGPTVEEAAEQAIIVESLRPTTPQPKSWKQFAMSIGLVAFFAGRLVTDVVGKSSPLAGVITAITAILLVAGMIVGLRSSISGGAEYVVEPDTLSALNAKLSAMVESMSIAMGCKRSASRVLTQVIYGRFGAILDAKGVGVTVHAMERLSDEEIDFLIAHELAHQWLGHLARRKWLSLGPAVLIGILFIALAFGKSMVISRPQFIFSPFLIFLVGGIPWSIYLRKLSRSQEFEADALAVKTTANAVAAESALTKVALNSSSPAIHEVDGLMHPAISARIQAIRALQI